MIIRKVFLVLLLCVFILHEIFAQDPQFTQIYSAPIFLNPAFAGNLEYDCRKLPQSRIKTNFNFRKQWGGDFGTFYGSVDYREKTGKLGIGATFIHDEFGLAPVFASQANISVSYKIPIDIQWQVHTGIQAGYHFRDVNLSRFTLPEQITSTGINQRENPTEGPSFLQNADISFFDFGAGALLFNERMYLGLSASHLNRPNQSFLLNEPDPLEYKFSVHGGYKLLLNKTKGFKKSRKPEKSITPTAHFRYQKPFMQMELGTFVNLEPAIFGIWYRGMPYLKKSPDGSVNQEALCLMAGLKLPTDFGLLRLGLSSDFQINFDLPSRGPTIELSVGYQFIDERCRKRIVYKRIPNPDL
jgi:type IX secretion system PorP/SprF family membrane protein